MDNPKTAVIIGAGPAGLTAAYKLLKETDIEPIVVEQESFVGGISRTAEHNGNRIDIGGHRFFTKSEEVNELWREILPPQGAPAMDDRVLGRNVPLAENGPDPEKTDRVLLTRERISRIYYLRKFFDYPVSLKPETLKNMGFANTMKAGFGFLGAKVAKRKEKTLEDFMINRFGTRLYEMFFKNYTAKVWGRDPSQIDASWGEQRIKGLSLYKTVANAVQKALGKNDSEVETSLIESFSYPKLGPGSMWETMRDEIIGMGGTVLMNTTVTGFEIDKGVITGVKTVFGGNESVIDADYVISSMPVKELIEALPDSANCPDDIRDVASSLPYRDFMTVGLLVDRLKLVNTSGKKTINGIVPDTWIYIQEDGVKLGRLQIFNNWSPYMVKDPANTVWLGLEYFCNEGDRLWLMPDEDFIRLATEELASIGIIEPDAVLDSVRIRVKKAYPAYFDSYSRMNDVIAYLNTIDNLYCVGRNGQHRYNNMDHSMLTAIEAVRLIVSGDKDRSSLWSVNTEKEYHEEK
ncbi:MAG: NAD(P)/FAD-dependent oxidoreductase [Clostridia bacterium]|nr:NAD(P)/FAD-dependent oxidoreductase [Clostridia bacterium]